MTNYYTANCLAADGNFYAVYFMTETWEQAEYTAIMLGLLVDEAGVCKMEEYYDETTVRH